MLFTLGHVPQWLCLRKWVTTSTTLLVLFHQQLAFFCLVLLSVLLWQAVWTWCQEVIPEYVVLIVSFNLTLSYLKVMEKFS